MKKILMISVVSLFIIGCSNNLNNTENTTVQSHITDVSVAGITYGNISKEIELIAETEYLKKNHVNAPISSFITGCYIQQGTVIHKGQRLYRLESRERKALGNDVIDNNMGIVDVTANIDGIVIEVQYNEGSYVTEGTTLCTIADIGSMAFVVDVPTENMKYAGQSTSCMIVLPDGQNIITKMSTPFASMNTDIQVQQVPAFAKTSYLPEGLRVKAILKPYCSAKQQILPKSALQSDDNMTTFWVMKVINNRCVKKIPIIIGNCNNTDVEIISPIMSLSDLFVTSGSYQLQDGDSINVIK